MGVNEGKWGRNEAEGRKPSGPNVADCEIHQPVKPNIPDGLAPSPELAILDLLSLGPAARSRNPWSTSDTASTDYNVASAAESAASNA
jgi:hypothetical protein